MDAGELWVFIEFLREAGHGHALVEIRSDGKDGHLVSTDGYRFAVAAVHTTEEWCAEMVAQFNEWQPGYGASGIEDNDNEGGQCDG